MSSVLSLDQVHGSPSWVGSPLNRAWPDAEPPNDNAAGETRFFYVVSELMRAALSLAMTRDELMLYLLHCRGYSPSDRASSMGEKAARDRLWMTKGRWKTATESLVSRGLILQMPVANRCYPKTVIGCPLRPFPPTTTVDQDRPSLWDAHYYGTVRTEELIKMPWRLIDGHDGTEPVLCEVETVEGIVVAMALYLVASGDGLIPNGLAHLGAAMEVQHRLGPIVVGLDKESIALAISELVDVGIIFPSCEDTRGRQVLRLCHPLEAIKLAA